MNDRERLRLLRATPQLAGVDETRLRGLLPFIDELCVNGSAALAEEGRLCHQFVILASGFLETHRRGRQGRLEPGDSFGWEAMQARGVNDATVLATTPAHVLVMSHEQFRAAEGVIVTD
jgi:CRP-like cAMP-binding protein